MNVHLVFPVLPPVLDGIGDHTAHLAAVLSEHCQVKILTGQETVAVKGVAVEQAFSTQRPRDICGLREAVRHEPPDWLILQYNPFSYGRWGFNPYLPLVMRHIKQQSPHTRVALMVHEPYVPVGDWQSAVMTTWQRWQLWSLGRTADLIFFSIDPWAAKFRGWFPGKPVGHLPVGSNIPLEAVLPAAARRAVGVELDAFVVGVFGSAHPSRLLHFVRAAATALAAAVEKLRVLYVGPAGGRVREVLEGIPVIDAGPLPPESVSRHFAAMDLYLAPFRKGVSSRRGSFMVGIQHGVATVSTYGVQTDAQLLAQNGVAFWLAADDDVETFVQHAVQLAGEAESRRRTAEAGRSFFEASFSWPRIADTLLGAMEACEECVAGRTVIR